MLMRTFPAVLATAIAVALAGCTTATDAPDVESRDMPQGAAGSAQASSAPRGTLPGTPGSSPRSSSSAAKQAAAGAPGKRAVYFDYDQVDIKPEYRPLIEAHARYLRENTEARTLIQGHADERGSREYNVALGQQRAESVKKMLTLLGASEKQIEAASLGEEKPACAQSSEACWSQNRRGQLLYSGEY
jgi:peptidoglycan-associated lipoprotein